MIILPERHSPRTRILLPVPQSSWRTPSQAQQKDEFGNENRTRFCIAGRLNDGHIRWQGVFEDRDDFDAFLFALVSGSLHYEQELWRLPTPWWHPYLDEGLSYSFITFTSLTTTSSSNQNFTVPADWNGANNTIHTVGAGSSGAVGEGAAFGSAGGGAGGAWAKIVNSSLTPGATAVFSLKTGGTAATISATGGGAGSTNGNTWFRIDGGTTAPASTAQGTLAEGGGQGGNAAGASSGTNGGATGGRTANSIGSSTNAGGSGGAGVAAADAAAGGAGGAAGPSGAGNAGATGTSAAGAGGSGDAGAGGAGGGGAGTEIDTVALTGAGGGGNAATSSGSITGGGGGSYGAGGGGAASSSTAATVNSGFGAQGLIVLSWTPIILGGYFLKWDPGRDDVEIVSY